MSASIENSWAQIESITQTILTAADKQLWDSVLELSSQRHSQLQAHFAMYPVGPDRAAFYRVRIDTLLRGERELQKTIVAARKVLMSEGMAIQQSNKAVGAYLSAALQR
jgi:hypothetical protein